ncbi:MAG: aldehyde dehydrogenase [Verrucomicrobia bacterium]|nr:aldehyde dehydrogenase [Verrucomicrobiota bacterium]
MPVLGAYQMFIDGQWVDGESTDAIEVENPANEETVATIPAGTVNDARRALEAARRALPKWADLPPIERAKLLHKLADAIVARRDHLARIVTLEQGKPLKEAIGEIGATETFIRYAAESARRIEGDILPSDNPKEEVWIRRVPFGVVVALTAWNYPSALAARKIGPALIAGNTVVLKGHECTPLSGLELARLVDEAGFPEGVLNVVTGPGRTVGEALTTSPLTDLVTMTGSVRAGKEIYRAGAEKLAVLRLELGGKAPFIVMEDANLDEAVQAAITARFTNCGQICTCNERMYLHERIADDFLERFVDRAGSLKIGNPMQDVDLGPKVNRPEVEKVESIVNEAVRAGAKVLLGGKRLRDGQFARGHWFEPTVLTGLENDAAIFQREVFGPVIPVLRFHDFEQAIRYANQTEYGLSAFVFTNDFRRIMNLSRALQFGEVYVNRPNGELIQGFHNGWRSSGLGGEDGKYGLDGYFRKQTTYLNFA